MYTRNEILRIAITVMAKEKTSIHFELFLNNYIPVYYSMVEFRYLLNHLDDFEFKLWIRPKKIINCLVTIDKQSKRIDVHKLDG